MIRPATTDDLVALVSIENRCFETDRLSRRNFRYSLTKGNAVTLVDEEDGVIRGYAMLLFNMGTSMARLYSLAVSPEFQGKGVGHALMLAVEDAAMEHDCITVRLEIRKDNASGIALYKKLGYREFGEHHDYYEDHMDAIRMEKQLYDHINPVNGRVPFFPQSLEFTCGPATLLMAMKALDSDIPADRKNELQLWRESTTIFMTAGHGGCDPYGMALAVYRRGFDVEIYVTEKGALFIDSVRSEEKKEVMRLVQDDFIDQIASLPIVLHHSGLTVAQLQEKFDEGGIPVVLISSYRIYREKFPHWVVVTGFDDSFIYVHDPYIDVKVGKVALDCVNMPIPRKDFERMAKYGKSGLRAVLIISKHKDNTQGKE